MIQNTTENKSTSSPGILRQTSTQIKQFNKILYQKQSNKSPTFLPAYDNTHIVIQCSDYNEFIIHFDSKGNKLGEFILQAYNSTILMLSSYEVFIYSAILKYNGTYTDYLYVWDLRTHTNLQCRYYGQDDQDYTINIQSFVFRQIQMICICQTKFQVITGTTVPRQVMITYYSVHDSQQPNNTKDNNKDSKITSCHTYFLKIDEDVKLKSHLNFKTVKLDQKGTVGIYHKQNNNNANIPMQVYRYNLASNKGNLQKIQLQLMEQNKEQIVLANIESVLLIKQSKYYMRLNLYVVDNKLKKQQESNKLPQMAVTPPKYKTVYLQIIWDSKQGKYSKLGCLSEEIVKKYHSYSIQFLNDFRPKTQSSIVTNPNILILAQFGNEYQLLQKIDINTYAHASANKQSKIKPISEQHCTQGNQIQSYCYIKDKNILIIDQIIINQVIFSCQQITAHLATSLIHHCDENLLEDACRLLSKSQTFNE